MKKSTQKAKRRIKRRKPAMRPSPSLARDLLVHRLAARRNGLDHSPGPFATLRLPQQKAPPLWETPSAAKDGENYSVEPPFPRPFAETFRDATGCQQPIEL